MFGMDARITVILAMVIALAVGVNQLSRINSDKAEDTLARMEKVIDAINRFTAKYGRYPYWDDQELMLTTTMDDFNQPFLASSNDLADAWGTPFLFIYLSGDYTSAHIVSAGADKVFNDEYGYDYSYLDGNCSNEVKFFKGDDLHICFNNYASAVDNKVSDETKLKKIMERIEAQAARNRLVWQSGCASGTIGDGSDCDYNGDMTYTPGEEMDMNFYPYAVPAIPPSCPAGKPVYADFIEFGRSYNTFNEASMEALMTMLGLPTSYARSTNGALVRYNSNVSNRCHGPFIAKVSWY